MLRQLKTALIAVVALSLLLGLAYPLLVTGVGRLAFPGAAAGSLLSRDGQVVGSRLIGQSFAGDPGYFQSRPSPTGYAADATAFSNAGPNSAALERTLTASLAAYLRRERRYTPGLSAAEVPPDAVMTSASGIDPQISPANARIQANRVSRRRGLPLERVLSLVEAATDDRGLGLFGEPAVNVLELNLALDREAGS